MAGTIIINLLGKETKKEPEVKTGKSEVQVEIKGDDLHIIGISDHDYLEYVARDFEKQSKFYILNAHKSIGYPSMRLHIGLENELVEAKVTHVERLRDGGTTSIRYAIGEMEGFLQFPSPLKSEKQPIDIYKGKTTVLDQIKILK